MSSDDRTLLSNGDAVPTQVDGDESYCAACGNSYPMDVDVCPNDGARLTKLKARPDELLGRVFDGRFRVQTSLGQGGMGTVYRGWQITVDREIAIKVIHPKLASDRIAVKRFLREARLSSRLNQPNIVNVYDFGQTPDGILYIAMELLRGHTLGRELENMRPMATKRVLTIALQLCDALDSAHAQGIVHRDLKPNNIVILDDPPGRDLIKVLDFGLAKSLITDTSSLVTNTNAILGTPLYMPPEQIEGKPSDQRADIYSLGCILFQMLSGKPPFVADSVNLVLAAHISDPVPPLPQTVPPALAKLVARMMAKAPAERIASAREVRETLQVVLEGGYPTSEVYDTTPDAQPEVDVIAIELAETHAATPSSTSEHGVRAQPVSVETTRPGHMRVRWLAPILVAAVCVGGAIVYFAARPPTTSSTPAAGPTIEVQPVAAPDAAIAPVVPAVVIDASDVDAPVAVPIDAALPASSPRPRPKFPASDPVKPPVLKTVPPVPRTVPPDAAPAQPPKEPELDFLKRDAGS